MNRVTLERDGFVGFVAFRELQDGTARHEVPGDGGVYVVLRSTGLQPTFLDRSVGGHFKGRDPTVSVDTLEANWIDGAEVVYIGKADNLHRRLREFAEFGLGRPIGHWGGRLMWQLSDARDLIVAWKTADPQEDPFDLEATYIDRFRELTGGRLPFANLAEPRRARSARPRRSADPTVPAMQATASSDDARSQRVTQPDLTAGRIRFPKPAKRLFPAVSGDVDFVLRGRRLRGRYDPRSGPDRERSAVLQVGRAALTELVRENEVLAASRDSAGLVHLA